LKHKNQIFRNSLNINSIGVSLIKTKDSKDYINSENNYSKSNYKTNKINKNIKANLNNNLKLNKKNMNKKNQINNYIIKQNQISYNKVDKTKKKILQKLKAGSPFDHKYNSRNKKLLENSNYYWNISSNKQKKKNIQNNRSLDNKKGIFKKKEENTAAKNKNIMIKSKNKILSRNTGGNNIYNNIIKNNTKEIFNNKLSNLTITNINRIKKQLSRNTFNNLSFYTGKSKKGSILNSTNLYLSNKEYYILNHVNKNKGIYFTNNNSNYIKKKVNLKSSKSKKNIYLKNNYFNRPVKKMNKKKN
jgi:hypothetical protein